MTHNAPPGGTPAWFRWVSQTLTQLLIDVRRLMTRVDPTPTMIGESPGGPSNLTGEIGGEDVGGGGGSAGIKLVRVMGTQLQLGRRTVRCRIYTATADTSADNNAVTLSTDNDELIAINPRNNIPQVGAYYFVFKFGDDWYLDSQSNFAEFMT